MISSYLLSEEADRDIDSLFDRTELSFGFDQAVSYLTDIDAVFQLLVKNPHIGRERNEIKFGLRSFPISAHVIFYRILDNHIRIVRVLDGGRDLPNFLKSE